MQCPISKVASEDTVFMVDISRSMFRKDLNGHRRLHLALMTLRDIINKKQAIDNNDRYSLVMFCETDLTNHKFVYNFNDINESIYNLGEITGETDLPLEKAIKSIINEKRKIGQKIFRIVIISDGYIHPNMENPIKIAKLASDLNIIIDGIRIGKGMISGNILKRITEITGGDYYLITGELDLQEAIEKVAEKKKIKVSAIFDEDKEDALESFSQDIASPLLKIEEMTDEQQAQINFEELKCSICHSEKCFICETSFYGCGRFCPNCFKPIHLHCAIKWADTQQGANSENGHKILRCPFCYYLLKIPVTVQKQSFIKSEGENIIRKVKFSDEATELMMSMCSVADCGILFDEAEDEYVYMCESCQSFFHVDCFKKHYAKDKKCPCCGQPSKLIDG